MQILGNQPRAAFPSAEPKALRSRNETAGAKPRKVTRSSLRASLGAGAPSHLHRHFAGIGNGFAGRSRLPSPTTATRRRSKEGERAHPLPLGRLPTAPRPLTRPRFSQKGKPLFSFRRGGNPKTDHRPPAPTNRLFVDPNKKAVMTDGLDKSFQLIRMAERKSTRISRGTMKPQSFFLNDCSTSRRIILVIFSVTVSFAFGPASCSTM